MKVYLVVRDDSKRDVDSQTILKIFKDYSKASDFHESFMPNKRQYITIEEHQLIE